MIFDRTTRGAWVVLALVLLGACHRGVEPVPLVDDLITLRDRWLDVATLDGDTVVVVGYGGRILRSEDGGENWVRVEAPTDRMLARVAFADRERGWVVGQEGVVLHTSDGGRSWRAQESGTKNHLFGLSAISPRR
ncbi:MAG: WD40/YVTN/BNR-like repeat-containing protein, partial [Candidatus Binatia bacterium]